MQADARPSNRLGCSRAFHQTKENLKDNGNGGVHSLPRNAHNGSSGPTNEADHSNGTSG